MEEERYSPSSGCEVVTVLTISQLTCRSDSLELSQTTSLSPAPQSIVSTLWSRASACASGRCRRRCFDVCATADPDAVVAVVAVHDVVAPAAAEDVAAPAAVERRCRLAAHAVVSALTVEGVAALLAEDEVVPSPALTVSSPPRAWIPVVARRAGQGLAVVRPLDDDDTVSDGGSSRSPARGARRAREP